MKRLRSATDLEAFREQLTSQRDTGRPCIAVCSVMTCRASKSEDLFAAVSGELKKRGLSDKVDVKRTACHGFCERGPVVVVTPQEICYLNVKAEDAADIVAQTIVNGKPVERLLYQDPASGKRIVHERDLPFYKNQTRILLGNNRLIDPFSIEDYIALGGYAALSKALFTMTPEKVLQEVKDSGLRGRGGAGFTTGSKWETTRNAKGDPKYVIVNADEGDPGAYMNRSLLEGTPHSVLEGLTIGAYAVGSHQGFIYVRQEYPLAVECVNAALEQSRKLGLLGTNILGSGFDFDIEVHRGAGAFVSGESSALMTAIEGKTGEPRSKYIHTAVSGVNGKPSVLNNVETWADVPLIVNNGAAWFKKTGTKDSPGTKIFSLVGKVNNSGLVEVPMGTTLRDIIVTIGGGVPEGKTFKAVQTGGPSGGCIPARLLDMPVDFDELTKVGSMMGSGGMIVMDEDTCMVDVARYFITFLSDESCGKCVPCREGLRYMSEILENICKGKGKPGDIERLEEICETQKLASLCALGTSAPNPVLSTINYFRDEYEAHINEKRCPAGFCKALVKYYIDPEKCVGCGICARECPVGAISGDKKQVHVIDQKLCTKCATCLEVCPKKFNAVVKLSGAPAAAAGKRTTAKK